MITLFKANDGKIFEDEDECLAYERMLQYKDEDDSIVFADENGKIFFLSDIIKDYELAEKIFYIYAKDYEGWSAGYEIVYKEYGCMYPDWQDHWDNSIRRRWFWDESDLEKNAKWVEIDEVYKKLDEKGETFNRMRAEIS